MFVGVSVKPNHHPLGVGGYGLLASSVGWLVLPPPHRMSGEGKDRRSLTEAAMRFRAIIVPEGGT
jgi:hypothetical protein